VKAARIAGFCVVLAGVALAGPQFRIGTKVSFHGGESFQPLYDTAGIPIAPLVVKRFSVGPQVEATYGPVFGFLTGRLDLTQLSFFTSGGAALNLFPMVGLDLMAEPTLAWRVRPYAWLGLRTAGSLESSPVIGFRPQPEAQWRGGLGVKYGLNSRIELFAETQMFEATSAWGVVDHPYSRSWMIGQSIDESNGIGSASIGARFALGK
jgi:hypothetical protein